MTTKHFIVFANAVRSIENKDNKELIINFLLGVLPQFNPLFNRQRFIDWCNK